MWHEESKRSLWGDSVGADPVERRPYFICSASSLQSERIAQSMVYTSCGSGVAFGSRIFALLEKDTISTPSLGARPIPDGRSLDIDLTHLCEMPGWVLKTKPTGPPETSVGYYCPHDREKRTCAMLNSDMVRRLFCPEMILIFRLTIRNQVLGPRHGVTGLLSNCLSGNSSAS